MVPFHFFVNPVNSNLLVISPHLGAVQVVVTVVPFLPSRSPIVFTVFSMVIKLDPALPNHRSMTSWTGRRFIVLSFYSFGLRSLTLHVFSLQLTFLCNYFVYRSSILGLFGFYIRIVVSITSLFHI